jgi:lipopolysaccharide export system protein LptA
MRNTIFAALLFLTGMLIPSAALAQFDNSDDPVHIEADRMVSRQKQNAIIFTGNVAASQGELTIHADEMTVYHYKSSENKQTQNPEQQKKDSPKIKQLHAIGNVKIVMGDLVATGNEMNFFAEKKKVIITGNTKVWQNNNLVTGEKIELDLNTETTTIEPDKEGGGRVKAILYPGNDKQ